MRRFVIRGGRRNWNAGVLSSLIIGAATVVFCRPLEDLKYIRSWIIAGQHFVSEATWPKPIVFEDSIFVEAFA